MCVHWTAAGVWNFRPPPRLESKNEPIQAHGHLADRNWTPKELEIAVAETASGVAAAAVESQS